MQFILRVGFTNKFNQIIPILVFLLVLFWNILFLKEFIIKFWLGTYLVATNTTGTQSFHIYLSGIQDVELDMSDVYRINFLNLINFILFYFICIISIIYYFLFCYYF